MATPIHIQSQTSFAFSWRMLWRDWRGGELRILAFALIIAVTSVSAVGFFIDRVERGLNQQAAELIAADLVISSSREINPVHIQAAEQRGLTLANVIQFRSVAVANEQPQLTEVKAVTQHYPLRGELRIADALYAEDRATQNIPKRGEVWVEPRLLQTLNLEVGDALQLGAKAFTISHVLVYEPDRGGDMFSVAPRVLMHADDVAATQLITTGALVTHRLLLGGNRAVLEDYRAYLKPLLQPGERLLSVKEGRPELRVALERAQRFLGLAALISVLLAGVAIATSARRYSQRHLDTSAMMRCLGATQRRIIRMFSLEMLWLAILASSIGCGLGLLTQMGISQILDELLLVSLPAPSWRPIVLGYASGVIL